MLFPLCLFTLVCTVLVLLGIRRSRPKQPLGPKIMQHNDGTECPGDSCKLQPAHVTTSDFGEIFRGLAKLEKIPESVFVFIDPYHKRVKLPPMPEGYKCNTPLTAPK